MLRTIDLEEMFSWSLVRQRRNIVTDDSKGDKSGQKVGGVILINIYRGQFIN